MKLRIKIMLCMLALLCVLFAIGGCFLIFSSFRASLRQEQDGAVQTYRAVVASLQAVNDSAGFLSDHSIGNILDKLVDAQDTSWPAVKFHSAEQGYYEHGELDFPSSAEQLSPWTCRITIWNPESNQHILLLSGSLEIDGQAAYLDLAKDITPVYELRQSMIRTFQWTYGVMALLCALLSYGISKSLTRPLEKLLQASRAIASGDLDCRADVRSNDEVGQVATEFNTMTDVLQDNITELHDMLERQNRFVGSFAHEMKTPMTSLIGYADLIRGQTLSPDEQAEAAHYIVTEGKRLEKLSQKLLKLFVLQREDLPLRPASPAPILRELLVRMEPVFRQNGITVAHSLEEGSCLLETDLLKSLLINLLDNAIKSIERPDGRIDVTLTMLDDGCRISVRDNGKGIPKEAISHLTEAFYRVDKARSREKGGVGLGLSICREIIALHQGNITFDSELGNGTCVTVELRGGRL